MLFLSVTISFFCSPFHKTCNNSMVRSSDKTKLHHDNHIFLMKCFVSNLIRIINFTWSGKKLVQTTFSFMIRRNQLYANLIHNPTLPRNQAFNMYRSYFLNQVSVSMCFLGRRNPSIQAVSKTTEINFNKTITTTQNQHRHRTTMVVLLLFSTVKVNSLHFKTM